VAVEMIFVYIEYDIIEIGGPDFLFRLSISSEPLSSS